MQTKKFRLSPKAIAWECSVLILLLPFLSVAFCGGKSALVIMGDSEIDPLRFISAVIFGLVAVVITICSLFLIPLSIGRAFNSYLLLSNQGLEYRLWPLHKIRCGWDDVGQIKKSALPFQGDLLVLKTAEVSGLQGLIKTSPVVPLYQINGWQNGDLESELRKYAPNLFDMREE
ncbi:MAG: hypothetical protein HFACDABA_02748 [Anaerolineales bacterium]|nr:hypothetical protein [Anaerolineales bacterium]